MIFRNPTNIHSPLANYSHQVEVGKDAKWLVMSGQLGMNKDGFVPEDVVQQVELTMDNIMENLRVAEMDISNLVKLVFYFVGSHDVQQRQQAVSEWLDGHQPCMTLLYVAGLAREDIKVEIDVWACK
jgi:enamine deaminase RidA (YjgF/YER057c/UK114 family)